MIEFFAQYWYLCLAIVFVTSALTILWWRVQRGSGKQPGLLEFLIFGPMVLLSRRDLTHRELLGWAIFVVIMVLAIVFVGSGRGA